MSELSNMKRVRSGEGGFSLLQMIVTVAIVAIVSNIGFMAVKNANRDQELAGEIRKFAGYLEKGRAEAIRRRTSVTVVTINSASSYTVTLDANYDGTVVATESRVITLASGLTFNSANITFPATITYNLQGRSSSTNITGSSISLSNGNGKTTNVTMTGGGDLTLDSTVTGPAAGTNLAPVTTVATDADIKSLQ